MNDLRYYVGKPVDVECALMRHHGHFPSRRKPRCYYVLAWRTRVLAKSVESLADSEEAPGLGMIGEQRPAEATRSCLNGSKVSTLFGGNFEESGVAWVAAVVSTVVMHKSNNT